MFFSKHKFLRLALILVLLGGAFGLEPAYSVQAFAFENGRHAAPAAQMQTTAEATNFPLVSLTFDDGNQSIYDAGFPILNAQGLPATFYFITDWLTEPWKVQLRDLQNHGWEIGSHTATHRALDTLSLAEVEVELSQSKAALEAAGLNVTGLAYPYGIGHQYPEIVQLTGQYYRYARTVHPGYNQAPLSPYVLLAQVQDSSVSLETMKGWVDTAIATNRWLIICMHQVDNTGGVYSISLADLTGLASYIKSKVNAGSIQAVTVQQGFDLYNSSTPPCYTLTLSHNGQGSNPTASPTKSAACSTNGQYVYGESIALSGAVPGTGWQISGWTGTANDGSTASTNSLLMKGSNHTVSVNYAQTEYSLTINSAHGTVTKNPNKATYHYGEGVQLTAVPATGWSFANWTGNATGTNNPVSVTIDGNKAVTANYAQIEYSLAITSPHGTVTKNPDKATYHHGDVVQLTAAPAAGWWFVNWTGDAAGTSNPVSVTINGNKTVTANYTQNGFTLTITSAHGTVTKSPDKAIYGNGEVVQLTATADHDWLFLNWTGDVTGTTSTISVTMDSSKTLTANYMRSGADTTGVFRPSNGLLYLKNKNETGFADAALNYGVGGDYPVVGDWDGNGTVTIGIYRSGYFYLRNSNTIGFAEGVFPFGNPGDQPIAGDWNGDGVDTIGVYRPSNGLFLLRNSNGAGVADMSFYLGNVGDVAITGDWDGDGIDTTGVFRPSNGVIFLKNANETGFADAVLNYGLPGDMPITGDWNNDGIDTIGIYRNGTFYLRNSNTNGFAEIVFGLGNPGDMPIAGNWDGLP
jgi:uncharacterized repeat protein (TIGR02543 family)